MRLNSRLMLIFPDGILVVFNIGAFLPPNTIPAYGYLQPIPEHTCTFGHVDNHKFIQVLLCSAERIELLLPLHVEVEPLAIRLRVVIQTDCQQICLLYFLYGVVWRWI